MTILGIDVGSSSVKSAILRGDRVVGRIVRERFDTTYDGVRAEVDAEKLLQAVARAIRGVGAAAMKVDAVALSTMSPSWVAMDKKGRAITPIVTHQDRRSVEIARELEQRVGKARHLKLAGNRPFPGGISSTTWAWFNRHEKSLMKRADLVGHVSTLLHLRLTAARVIDPSHASFMGLYSTLDQSGWSDELMTAVGAGEHQLPQLISGDGVAGLVTHEAGRRFGLTHGTPVLVGLIDTGSAMLLAGAKVGQLLNSAGSTDVLALCTDRPIPHERLLTRALGVGKIWLSVSTLAAGGSTFEWVRRQIFADFSPAIFAALTCKLARQPIESSVRFEPHLAGDRMSMEQRHGAFSGLTLAATREQMLSAVIESIAQASVARLKLLTQTGTRLSPKVVVTGGVSDGLGDVLHRDWKGARWTFRQEKEATLRGLGRLID
ncbi:MAG: FGGY family carbohydrate kinase [Tepidisphaeraceae bacterium]